MNEKKSVLRKRCLMKPMCSTFFVYFLAFAIISILYLSSKRMKRMLTPETISITQGSDKNSALPHEDDWRQVSGMVYVYSAFWEYRTKPTMVRIIGIGFRVENYASQLVCILSYAGNKTLVTPATSKNFEDHHDMKLSAKFFYCTAATKPEKVALVSLGSTTISWLLVHDTSPSANASKNDIAICTQPLYRSYENSLNEFNVAEFIAYYEILGVTRFVFYDYKTGSGVMSFLNRLSSGGSPLIKILPWTLPKELWKIWNAGQGAAVADCVYRNAPSNEYVAIVDFDEYIVPTADITLQKLLQQLTENNGSKWSSYMFRHSFFCLNYPDDLFVEHSTLPFVTQVKTRRGKIWSPYARAKSIVRPRAVILPGIHYTWEAIPKLNISLDVGPPIALLHHYRGDICRSEITKTTIDRTAWRYRERLQESAVINLWRNTLVS